MKEESEARWVLLTYRLPRNPSGPRLALWRRLRKLGVAQLGDGLVALPRNARTKEHLEWSAAAVLEAGGEATVWLGSPGAKQDEERLVALLRDARNEEYEALIAEATAASSPDVDGRTLARLRRTLRDIDRRDYFRAPSRDAARRAVTDLTPSEKERTS